MADPFTGDARYHRQMLLPGIGTAGQDRLGRAHALVVGCGALGTVIVDALARAGVGTLTIVDRDFVEVTNLQRQILFDESDVEAGLPKAEAARRKVRAINRNVTVNAVVRDCSHRTINAFAGGADIIIDGLDNFETRYLLNDYAVRQGRPYIYGGAVATTGAALLILPHSAARAAGAAPGLVEWNDEQATPCLRCVFPEPPPPGASPTCDTAGVLGPLVTTVAAHQAAQAIKLLSGNVDAADRSLLSIDMWANDIRQFDVSQSRGDCPCCSTGTFDYLEGTAEGSATTLCGRTAVQVVPGHDETIDLGATADRLAPHGAFIVNDYLLRGELPGEHGEDGAVIELTLFADGRAIIKGTSVPDTARSIYARYVGT